MRHGGADIMHGMALDGIGIGTAIGTIRGMTIYGVGRIGHGTITGMTCGGVRYITRYMPLGPDTAILEVPVICLDTADQEGMYITAREIPVPHIMM